jgi:hypothetical protein
VSVKVGEVVAFAGSNGLLAGNVGETVVSHLKINELI